MTENDCHDPVIGVAFDGTGYGTDGTIWGGEILLADYGNFTRFGSITPFLQMGGDASAKEGWRIAVSMIYVISKGISITAKSKVCATLFQNSDPVKVSKSKIN